MKIMNKKQLITVVSILLLLAVAVGGTAAFLAASTDPLINTFTPSKVGVEIEDTVDGNVKSNVVITNTGTTNAYIRARIVGSWVNDAGITVQAWNPTADGEFKGLPGKGWVARGDYYYYTLPVAPGDPTATPLFTSYEVKKTVDGAHLVLDILVQAIQSEGGAAQAAWGVDPATLSEP